MSEQNEQQAGGGVQAKVEEVEDQQMAAAGGGLFGDDDDEEDNAQHQQQQQQEQQYLQDDLGLDDDHDDILGLDEGAGEEAPVDHEGALLMRFCPHDSSMLYPKVSSHSYI